MPRITTTSMKLEPVTTTAVARKQAPSNMAFGAPHSTLHMSTTPPSPPATSTRRSALRFALAAAAAATTRALAAPLPPPPAAAAASAPTVVNSVLSAYGMPQLADKSGFSVVTAQFGATAVEFAAPSAWVVQRNAIPLAYDEANVQASAARLVRAGTGGTTEVPEGPASPLTAGDYRKAEGASFHALSGFKGLSVKDVAMDTVRSLVVPNKSTGRPQDARLVKGSDQIDDDGFKRRMEFVFETVTTSGYSAERRCRAVFSVQGGRLFALAVTATALRFKKLDKAGTWDAILDSFHVAIL